MRVRRKHRHAHAHTHFGYKRIHSQDGWNATIRKMIVRVQRKTMAACISLMHVIMTVHSLY